MCRYICAAALCLASAAAVFAQDAKLRILEIPLPERPADYGSLEVQGTIRLRVEFRADGNVGRVIPISRLTGPLDELAIEAAKRIVVEPQLQGGRPVTVVKTVSYDYSWRNPGWRGAAPRPDISPAAEPLQDAQAEAVLQKAIRNLGGEKYLGVKSQIGRGRFSVLRDGQVVSFQTFVDVIVFPDKERTEFKSRGVKTVQTNTGDTGWVYDGEVDRIKDQTDVQVANFKRGMRTSLDNLLRGHWRGSATLSYAGRRPATLGKRNDVIKLVYEDGLAVEFEFAADDGLPVKAIYKRGEGDDEVTEEDRYAQFIEIQGIRTPFIIDRFSSGKPASRINYESVEFNRSVPDSIFDKPANLKDAKKDLKL